MATSRTVASRFAQLSGYLSSTLDRMQRDLRAAGFIPMGEKGRGSLRGHYEAIHLANLIAAFWGAQPSDAAETVRLVRDMSFQDTSPGEVVWPRSEPNAPHVPGANPIDAIAHMIEGMAQRQERMEAAEVSEDDARALPWNPNAPGLYIPDYIVFRDSPKRVEFQWISRDDEKAGRIDLYFSREPTRCFIFSRSNTVQGNLIIPFTAELLRTNPMRKHTSPPATADTEVSGLTETLAKETERVQDAAQFVAEE